MKKKLALLLALSMVLSMVPVVTFGAGRAIYTLTEPAVFSDDRTIGNDEYEVVIAIKANAFRAFAVPSGEAIGILSPVGDKFNITDMAPFKLANGTYYGSLFDGVAAYDDAAAQAKLDEYVTFDSTKYRGSAEIKAWPEIGSNKAEDDLYIKLTLVPRAGVDLVDEYYVEFVLNNKASTLISGLVKDDTLVAVKASSWTIEAGDKVFFADIASINNLKISEKVAQQFAWDNTLNSGAGGPVTETIQLVLPYGFSWMDGSIRGGGGGTYLDDIDVAKPSRFITPYLVSTPTVTYAINDPTPVNATGDKRVLTLKVSRNSSDADFKTPSSFEITGLRFVAGDNARPGDVAIRVYTNGGFSSVPKERDIKDGELLTVANYSNYGLVITENDTDDDMAELFSGVYGEENGGDGVTSLFTITELTPNSFPTSRTETLGARFDAPEGVQFKKAYVWFGVYGNDAAATIYGATVDDHAEYEVGDAPDGNGVRLIPGSLYISPPMDRVNTKDVYTLSVYFEVSVIAGFVGPDEDSKDINISFEGTILDTKEIPVYESDGKTLFGKKEIAVATVVDRITVSVEKAAIEESNAGLYVMNRPVNDIVIKETEVGMLELNTELWVFVDSPRTADITFSTDLQPTTDSESTLRVSRATKLEVPELPTGIRFSIIRESGGDVPGTITIPGAMISGFLYPRVDYSIVVTGNSVAMSHDAVAYYEQFTTTTTVTDTLSQYLRAHPALFEKSLYRAALFSYTGDTLLEVPGEPGTGVVGGTSEPRVESMSFGADTIMTSDGPLSNPFRTNLPGTVGDTGYLALRAFEKLNFEVTWLGGNTSKIYDPYTKQTLTYYIGSEVGYLDGAPVTFVNNDGVPAKVLQATVDGEIRTFLPARTVASLFGYEVDCPAPYTTVYLNLIK